MFHVVVILYGFKTLARPLPERWESRIPFPILDDAPKLHYGTDFRERKSEMYNGTQMHAIFHVAG